MGSRGVKPPRRKAASSRSTPKSLSEDDDEDENEDDLAMEWLARVWFGRCGLVARVPQDRMPSLRVH